MTTLIETKRVTKSGTLARDELAALRSACRADAPLSIIVTALLTGIVLASTTLYLNGMDATAAILLR